MSSIVLTILAIAIIGLWLNYQRTKKELDKFVKYFPTPPRVPILGITKVVKGFSFDPYEAFHTGLSFTNIYGENVIFHGFFNHVELIVSRSKDLETIMTGKTTKKSRTYDFLDSWLGEGLLVSFGTKWFNRRKIITPTFHFKILEQFLDIFNEQDKKMIQKLQKYVDNKEECNIYQYLTLVALDSICETAMGVKINAQDNPKSAYIDAIKEITDILFKRFFSVLNQYPLLWSLTPAGFRSREVTKILHKFTDTVIENRRNQLKSEKPQTDFGNDNEIEGKRRKISFLDMLLQAKIDGKPLSHLEVREEVDTFMFEGHDTTTVALSFAVYHLAMNPKVQDEAFDELKNIMGSDPSTFCSYNDLQEMKYLEKVIKESLRLHPSVPVIGRNTTESIEIDGVTIPSNINIQIPIYAIHRKKTIFGEDAEKFDPERFNEENERTWGSFDYIPFSAGTRNCVGQRYAMMEMKAVLSSILRNYKVVATEKTRRMLYRADLVLRPVDGVYVKLEKRFY